MKDKGYFKDPDRQTEQHQEICMWFANHSNVQRFVRMFLCDVGLGLRVELEAPVKSSTGFLYGYADICISYRTDQSRQQKVLVEVKSSFSDFGQVLRQIRTYQEFLGDVTKTCLIHAGLSEGTDEKAIQYFGSQGIYIASMQGVRGRIDTHLLEGTRPVPEGKRDAVLSSVWISPPDARHLKNNWHLEFLVSYRDEELEDTVSDLLSTGNYFSSQNRFWELTEAFGLEFDRKMPKGTKVGELSIPCVVDLSYRPGETGYPEAVIERVYVNEAAVDVI